LRAFGPWVHGRCPFGPMTVDDFISLLPREIYCTDDLSGAKERLPARDALKRIYIQPNTALSKRFLLTDIDRADGWFMPEEARFLVPSWISINRENGHVHVAYILEREVAFHRNSRLGPQELFHDVRRGITNRLKGDPSYVGLYCKNPFHPRWATDWQSSTTYDLLRLSDSLRKEDRNRIPAQIIGEGRNCTTFNLLRQISYKKVWSFKTSGKTQEDLFDYLMAEGEHINATFSVGMTLSEVRGIAKSVAKWTWTHFNAEKFSDIQRKRVMKRWEGHETLTGSKPWEADGISRRTWERRRAKIIYP
jgi:hypothetical protein